MKKKILYLLYLLLLVVLLVPTIEEAWTRSRFLVGNDFYQKDSIAGFIHTPNYTSTYEWPEHPLGKITVKTNNLGFKEDSETRIQKDSGTTRILFTGDSHTDGVVYNNESFVQVIEDSLHNPCFENTFECLNGGSGYYSFKQYDGFLEKYKHLSPGIFVVVIYTGNDFLETQFYDVSWSDYFQNSRNFLYKVKKKYQLGQSQDYLAQSFAQTLYANMYPSSKEQMVKTAMNYLKEIKNICEANRITFRVVLLPSLLDYDSSMQALAMEKMHLTKEEVKVNRSITEMLQEKLTVEKIIYLDLLPAFAKSEKSLYWKRDQHLNVEGHKLAAKEIFDFLPIPKCGQDKVQE